MKKYSEQLKLVWKLSIPAILAQITTILMEYIDAAMVGSLGAEASASIGLVATSTWLLGGICSSVSAGFSVQVAQAVGAKDIDKSNQILKQGLFFSIIISAMLSMVGIIISKGLPVWLGGQASIQKDASAYFMIFAISIPAMQMNSIASSMLQCSGNMKTPSILNGTMCILDMIFNAILIFPTGRINVFGLSVPYFGFNLGVAGAALGTALAQLLIAVIMLWQVCFKSKVIHLKKNLPWTGHVSILKKAMKIAIPIGFEHIALCGAMVATTKIVAPLGTVAIAANSFGVTAESLCYMPGYGIASAATTLVGQSVGAGRKELTKRYAWMTVINGMVIMGLMGVMMFFVSPYIMQMLTPDKQVQALGVAVLRIEVFAEPFYAASIVASGALRGAGDTLIPSILNLVSIWGVRLTMSILLAGKYGLKGVWFAMCIELCVRGGLFLFYLAKSKVSNYKKE